MWMQTKKFQQLLLNKKLFTVILGFHPVDYGLVQQY